MGSANNCYPEVFSDVFLFFFFCVSSFNMDDFVKPFRDGSVGKDQSCSGERKKKETLVSMICNRRRILCFSSFLLFFLKKSFFLFSIYLQMQKTDKKNLSLPKKKSCLVISCQYIFIGVWFSFPWVCRDELL